MTTLPETKSRPRINHAIQWVAQESPQKVARMLAQGYSVSAQLMPEEGSLSGQPLELPPAVVELLFAILTEMAQGNMVTLIPDQAELTTQQAADFLQVSRPFLIELLEKGEIPHTTVGVHRRIPFRELREFQQRAEEAAEKARDELVAQAQEEGMGY
jgi:excisionase family DNA binding protein